MVPIRPRDGSDGGDGPTASRVAAGGVRPPDPRRDGRGHHHDCVSKRPKDPVRATPRGLCPAELRDAHSRLLPPIRTVVHRGGGWLKKAWWGGGLLLFVGGWGFFFCFFWGGVVFRSSFFLKPGGGGPPP